MINRIGCNAGKIWHQLESNGPQTPSALAKSLKMKSPEVLLALGWLAREEKLNFMDADKGVKVSIK